MRISDWSSDVCSSDLRTKRTTPMYSESDLQAAVDAKVLTPEAAMAFRSHIASVRAAPGADEESFRLITGFNDIFVSIAAVILLVAVRSEEHTSELQSLMRISYAVFCLKKKNKQKTQEK